MVAGLAPKAEASKQDLERASNAFDYHYLGSSADPL